MEASTNSQLNEKIIQLGVGQVSMTNHFRVMKTHLEAVCWVFLTN